MHTLMDSMSAKLSSVMGRGMPFLVHLNKEDTKLRSYNNTMYL